MPAPEVSPTACRHSSDTSIRARTNCGLMPDADDSPDYWNQDLDSLLSFGMIFFKYIIVLPGPAPLFVFLWSNLAKKKSLRLPIEKAQTMPARHTAHAQRWKGPCCKMNCRLRDQEARKMRSQEVRMVCTEKDNEKGVARPLEHILCFLLDVSHFSVSRRGCVHSVCPTLTHHGRTVISHQLCHIFII